MLFRVPMSVGKVVTGAALLSSMAVVSLVAYKRFVVMEPFKIVRDETGAYRWQTRLELIDERLKQTLVKLEKSPQDQRLAYEAAVWMMAKRDEETKLKAEGTYDEALTDEDLSA